MPQSNDHPGAATRPRAFSASALRRRLAALFLVLLAVSASAPAAQAAQVTLDTSALAGTAARLEINLFDGNGSFDDSRASAFGEAVSDFGQILHEFIAGGVLSFALSFDLRDADLLVLSLLDADTNFSLVDTDLDAPDAAVPYEDAVLVCRPSSCTPAARSDPALDVSFVAEPGTLALLGVLPAVLTWRRRRGALRRR